LTVINASPMLIDRITAIKPVQKGLRITLRIYLPTIPIHNRFPLSYFLLV
jgi:hypothetical protein